MSTSQCAAHVAKSIQRRGDGVGQPVTLEQMVNALQDADLAMCKLLHNYFAWEICPAGTDLGSWMARAELIRKVPWKGDEFTSDQDYIKALKALAGERAVAIEKPLFVHN